MQQQLDPRIISVDIDINGTVTTYTDIAILATGTKFANANQNECEVKLTNLNISNNEYILTLTSPFNLNRVPKILRLFAGRKSYGTTLIYSGNIVSAVISQPPDQTITLKCLTANDKKGMVSSQTQPTFSNLSTIAKNTASNLNLNLNFTATDKQIGNYAYSGPALKEVDQIGELGSIDAYVDNNTLVVKDSRLPLPNRLRIVDADHGMVGIPELTETGIKVKYLLDNSSTLGGGLRVISKMYPAANGDYAIYKLGFEIANRDTPFYWIAEGARL